MSETVYQARFVLPEELERGREETISCPVYYEGALVAPTSGAVTVLNASGNALVDAASVTVSGDVAQYTISSSLLDSESFADGWLVKWVLVINSKTYTFNNDASLVRYRLYPVLTDVDLFKRVPALNPSDAATITTDSNFQGFLEEAWIELMLRVIEAGNRPNLIMSPTSLRGVHLYKTLELIYRDLGSYNQPEYLEEANRYESLYESAFSKLNFRYDSNEDGRPQEKRSAVGQIWLRG